MLKNDNKNFISSVAVNYAAITGYLFLFYWLFRIYRILLKFASFDCGSSCLPQWVHFDYPIDNFILEYYFIITISSLVVFILMYFCGQNSNNENKNKKITFFKLLLLILKMIGVVLFFTNIICTYIYFN